MKNFHYDEACGPLYLCFIVANVMPHRNGEMEILISFLKTFFLQPEISTLICVHALTDHRNVLSTLECLVVGTSRKKVFFSL